MNFIFYYTGAVGLCVISALALFEKLGSKRNLLFFNNVIYLAAISIFLIINKLSFLNSGMLNVDESLMLGGGRTLGYDFRPWISVDPTTSGPINFLPAILLLKIFSNASYGELRIFYVIAFQLSTLIILFTLISKIAGHLKARLTIIPLTLCFAFFFYYDHMHASSEHLPMLFTAIGVATIIRLAYDRLGTWQIILCGSLCAIGPFAKLQIAPLLFVICFVSFVLLALKKRWKGAAWLTGSFILTIIIILLAIYLYGGFYDFFQSYIRSNMRYTAAGYSRVAIDKFIDYSTTGLLPLLLFTTFIFVWTWTYKSVTLAKKIDYQYMAIFVLLLLIAGYCVIKPGRFFPHYGLLLVVPLYSCFLWIAVRSNRFDSKLIPYFVAGISVLLIANINKTSKAFIGWELDRIPNTKILNILKADSRPTDRLAAWGWGSVYVQEAKLLMGTRDVHSEFQSTYAGPVGDYYKSRFLEDLNQNHPKWFLDVSGPGQFGGSEAQRLRHFPEIYDYVFKNYRIVCIDKSATLYRQKEK